VDEAGNEKDGQKAYRNIDVEGIAPAERIGQPAAQRRPQHRRDHDTQTIGGHGHGALLRRKAFQQDRLRERLQRAAARTLQYPASRITASDGAAPQKNEATVKMITQVSRNRFRPNRRANQFDAGRITALATR
jgi:hypothetical protein